MELNGLLAKFRGPSDPHSAGNPLPSFVLLHGYGSNEDDLFSFERFFPAQSAVFSMRAPLALAQGGRAWFSIDFEKPRSEWSNHEEAEQSIDQLLGALEALPAAAGCALLPPVLVGFSQGAILSLATVLQAPTKIRGVAAFSGYWNKDLTCGLRTEKRTKSSPLLGQTPPTMSSINKVESSWITIDSSGWGTESTPTPSMRFGSG